MKVVEDLFRFQLEYFSKAQIFNEPSKFSQVLLVLALTQKAWLTMKLRLCVKSPNRNGNYF